MRPYQVCLVILATYIELIASRTLLTGAYGSFSSRGYPEAYPTGTQNWLATARPGYVYKVFFTSFDVLCSSDFLEIGPDRLCGNLTNLETEPNCPGQPNINREFKSNSFLIKFTALNSPGRNNIGFEGQYIEEDLNECENMEIFSGLSCNQYCHNTLGSYYCSCLNGYKLRNDLHTCESNLGEAFVDVEGEYPQTLPIRTDDICEEVIIVPPGQTIEFTFDSDFVIDEDCIVDGETASISIIGEFENPEYTFCYQNGPNANCSNKRSQLNDSNCLPLSTLIEENSNVRDASHLPITVGSSVTLECNEFYVIDGGSFNWVCHEDKTWRETGSSPLGPPHCRPDCGMRNSGDAGRIIDNSAGRVVGGEISSLGQWPWAAFITYDSLGLGSRNFCGGSLINEQYVVSAAHCHRGDHTLVEEIEIIIGFVFRSEPRNRDNLDLQRFEVISHFLHPSYSEGIPFNHDIVLYRLGGKATLSQNVRPICLPLTREEMKLPLIGTAGYERSGRPRNGFVVGWGIQRDGTASDTLNMASLPLIDRTTCERELAKQSPDKSLRITENMFCVGNLDQVIDSCGGDSGGPMMWEDMLGRSFLNGIVSFGSSGRDCTTRAGFGVYTNVSNYIGFIDAATDSPHTCEYPHELFNISNTVVSVTGYDFDSTITVSCRPLFDRDENKFYEWVCDNDRIWKGRINRDARLSNPEDLPRCIEDVPECGRKNMRLRGKRAVGARNTWDNEWPWMAFIDTSGRNLGVRSHSFCGGSLVHPQFVVTSARCTSFSTTEVTFNRFQVHLGVKDRRNNENQEAFENSFDILQRSVPEEYNSRSNAYNHDIAVLKLDRRARLGNAIRTVCLPRTVEHQNLPDTAKSFAAGLGWGRTENSADSNILKLYRVPKIQICRNRLNRASLDRRGIGFTRNMFCAGLNENQRTLRNFCMMDEGGPLMFRSPELQWYLNGVSSFTSFQECHVRTTVGIYTDVSQYIGFIDGVINEN